MKPLLQPGLRKYALGLSVIMVFVLVLLVLVLVKAGDAKQDNNTYNAANAAAEKLNSYVNEQQQIPDS